MGDNARVDWDWHNKTVGEGYQARGVIRQRGVDVPDMKVIDYSKHEVDLNDDHCHSLKKSHKHEKKAKKSNKKKAKDSKDHDQKKKKKKKKAEKSHRKEGKKKSNKSSDEDTIITKEYQIFNPLLQYFVSKLSDQLAVEKKSYV
jgi:sRNA-binding protein